MDHCAAVLLSFPTTSVEAKPNDKDLFESALKVHVGNVERLFKDQGEAIFAHAVPLLEVRNPVAARETGLAHCPNTPCSV